MARTDEPQQSVAPPTPEKDQLKSTAAAAPASPTAIKPTAGAAAGAPSPAAKPAAAAPAPVKPSSPDLAAPHTPPRPTPLHAATSASPPPLAPSSDPPRAPQQPQQPPAFSPLFRVSQNEVIVHQLLLTSGSLLGPPDARLDTNPTLSQPLGPLAPASGSNGEPLLVDAQAAVQAIARNAFWDALRDSLSGPSPDWPRLAVLLSEMRDSVLDVVPQGGARSQGIRAMIKEKLDEEYIAHRLQAGGPAGDLLYLRSLFDWLAHLIMQLEAPARAEDTQKGYKAIQQQFGSLASAPTTQPTTEAKPDIPSASTSAAAAPPLAGAASADAAEAAALPEGVPEAIAAAMRFLADKLSELRADVARYRLQMLKNLLQSDASGVEYERRRYERAIEQAGCVAAALPRTASWLHEARDGLEAEAGALPSGPLDKVTVTRVVSHGLLQLIQQPASLISPTQLGLPALPETLALDAQRMVGFQNELQRLSLVAAVALLAKQVAAAARGQGLAAQGTAQAPGDAELADRAMKRFLVLLADTGVGMEDCVEELTRLVAEALGLAAPTSASVGAISPSTTPLASTSAGARATTAAGTADGTGAVAASSSATNGSSESPSALAAKREAVSSLCRAMLRRVFSATDPVYRKVQGGVARALGTYLEAAATAPMNADAAAAAAAESGHAEAAGGGGNDVVAKAKASAASGVAAHRQGSLRGQVGAALRPIGAEAMAGEVCTWGAEVQKVMQLNLAVCRPYYEKLLSGTASSSSNNSSADAAA